MFKLILEQRINCPMVPDSHVTSHNAPATNQSKVYVGFQLLDEYRYSYVRLSRYASSMLSFLCPDLWPPILDNNNVSGQPHGIAPTLNNTSEQFHNKSGQPRGVQGKQ